MLNLESEPMKKFIKHAHKMLEKKAGRSKKADDEVNADIIRSNRLIKLLFKDKYMAAGEIADIMNEKYGYDLTGWEITDIFKSFHISREERHATVDWANELGDIFIEALESGGKQDLERFIAKRKENPNGNNGRSQIKDQMACMKLCELLPEIGKIDGEEIAEQFGAVLSKYYLYDITDGLSNYCSKENAGNVKSQKPSSDDKIEVSKRKIEQLEKALELSDMMLKDLQDEFDERLEDSKIKNLVSFFSQLNTEKYGCILDELLNVRRGVSLLRKQNYELPPEISGLLIMTQKLTQFVRDSGINPIMKPQEIKKVKLSDIDFCDYEGTPFGEKNAEKTVEVISPGWIYSEKDLQIARPKLKEVVEDEQ